MRSETVLLMKPGGVCDCYSYVPCRDGDDRENWSVWVEKTLSNGDVESLELYFCIHLQV